MNIDHLVRMANRIGEFFQAMPDHAEALDGIASHILRFWAPRMRHALAAHIDRRAGDGLMPLVHEALRLHRSVLD